MSLLFTFDRLNVSLLNKSIFFTDTNVSNGSVYIMVNIYFFFFIGSIML